MGMRSTAALLTLTLAALAACHGDKKPSSGDSVAVAPPVDTTPQDLSKVQTGLPAAAPDTFTPPKPQAAQPDYPPAPPALM
jgi:hypothetical protein